MGEIFNYPRDILRHAGKGFFVKESSQHQAKLEIQTYRDLVTMYTKPGDTILDPMSGIGTVHYASYMGRNTIGIEISENFANIQYQNMGQINGHQDGQARNPGCLFLLHGDCRRFLPLSGRPMVEALNITPYKYLNNYTAPPNQIDIVIFSPPYGDLWKTGGAGGKNKMLEEKHINIGYSNDAGNVGNTTNYPIYLASMTEIYKLCNRSLKPAGRMIIVTKDFVRARRRIYVTKDNIVSCMDAGFAPTEWHKRYTDPKIFQIIARKEREDKGLSHPELDIDYEDVIVFEKVQDV